MMHSKIRLFVALLALSVLVDATAGQESPRKLGKSSKKDNKKGSKKFYNKPRVRREWRTLSQDKRVSVASALRIMKEMTTQEGRNKFGELYWNLDDLTMLHACSLRDPRCDQGHYGPHFMTFHRGYLLRLENSLLAVDPSIEALPYWDYDKDTQSGECFENPDCYIFSDKFFGDVQGDPAQNYAVTNGLFAYWPITPYTTERFGADSPYDFPCLNEQYFEGVVATTCERCCGDDACTCDEDDDVYPHWLRDHDDCTPYVARNPDEVAEILDTRDLLGTDDHFNHCTDPENIRSHMDWQNCIEFEQFSCFLHLAGVDCESTLQALRALLPPGVSPPAAQGLLNTICEPCALTGYYYDKNNEKHRPQALHSQTHIRLGRDILDVTTSPNDVSVFTGYHSNLDRNHMTWMMNTYDELESSNWLYPAQQNDWAVRNFDGLSGPFSSYAAMWCAFDADVYTEYNFGSKGPWLNGTLAGETTNSAFPFDDLWKEPPANGYGYTHAEMMYYADPSRTVYTYDTLEHYYY